jgi:hypothetical protein
MVVMDTPEKATAETAEQAEKKRFQRDLSGLCG